MEKALCVHLDLDGTPHLVGRLWAHVRGGRESASFEYDPGWLVSPVCFSLEPALVLGPGPYHTESGKPLFGAIGDSAPDRWGQVLMRRAERRRAEAAAQTPSTLAQIDYLLLVDDTARLGALRFSERPGGPFLRAAGPHSIPPLLELAHLLSAAQHVLSDTDTAADLRLLLAPGSSLGGARPKASVRDRDGQLALGKFPAHGDEIKTTRWEALALSLAAAAGIPVPQWRIALVARQAVLLLRRFDRDGERRIPFVSAMSMLDAKDHEGHCYLEMVDMLRRHGAAPKADMHALWRRIVFNILISNTDDHLRNHGFLWEGPAGWRLSPAYDLNPVPTDIRPRILATAIDIDDANASLDVALRVAAYFELTQPAARVIAAEVGVAVASWRSQAAKLSIPAAEIDRMASAFEHDDLRQARAAKVVRASLRPSLKAAATAVPRRATARGRA